jgi:hypothetical protein
MELVDGVHVPRRSGDKPLPLATLEVNFQQLVE